MASTDDLYGDTIDQSTFEQILEMDEDEDEKDFSKGIVFGFFEQAEGTFKDMEAALAKKDLEKLASDGHFLKGSSATLGLTKVQECCEKIQHYGNGKDEAGDPDAHSSDAERLANIKKEVALARREYAIVEAKLRKFFNEP